MFQRLQKKVDELLVEKKKLEDLVKSVESENSSLLKRVEADQADIDILKVRIADLEEERARRDEQNEYFKLKNKELEANNAKKEHEMYMMNKVLENLIGKPVEQRFEEIELEEVRARRRAEIEAEMKKKGEGVQIEGIKVTEASSEEKIDEYLHDDANEEPENAEGEGELDDTEKNDENVDHVSRLILRLEHSVEEGEIMHTYTLAEIIKMTHVDENELKFDFEEELKKFDINQQREYKYKYVEDADNYDKVEVEDCSDEEQFESIHVDTSNFPTLAEFFSQANEDELRRKVTESVKSKSFHEMSKDEQREERKKWFRKDSERKFKRPLKFHKRDREVSLGDIISWGFL
ncbi:hypothetical protein Hanom_Chr02g00128281 [Helianthus anomalus]